jgi:hypothetical protein
MLKIHELYLSTSHELLEHLNQLHINPSGKILAAMKQSLLVLDSKGHMNDLESSSSLLFFHQSQWLYVYIRYSLTCHNRER